MRYLENAFRFTFKNFLITLPLLISMAIPAFILSIGTRGFMLRLTQKYQQIIEDMVIVQNIDSNKKFIDDIISGNFFTDIISKTMIVSIIVASLLYIFFAIIVYPATYGLINKKYETGSATLSDITGCISKYIGRFIQYILLCIAIGIGVLIVFVIFIAIGGVIIATVSPVAGIILLVLFYLAFIVGGIALGIYLSLWFPAVCIENTGIVQGLKNSFKYVKGSFWPILGITILISLCGSVAGAVLGWVPLIGSVVSSVTSSLAGFVTIVFYFEIYREKSGRFTIPENFNQLNGGVQ